MPWVGESTGELEAILEGGPQGGPPRNLHHLNEILIKYIKMVQALEMSQGDETIPRKSCTIDVKIDRSKLLSVGMNYGAKLTDCKDQCTEVDEEIAALEAKICQLEAEIKILIKRNSGKDGAILDKDLMIEKLTAEINRLKASLTLAQNQKQIFDTQLKTLRIQIDKTTENLNSMVSDYIGEKKKNSGLSTRLGGLEKQLSFKISTMNCEMETESCGDFQDFSGIDSKINHSYKIKMDGQLELLRKLYEQHTVSCRTSLESVYKNKITDLKQQINLLPDNVEMDNDFQVLQVQLEREQLKAANLETTQLELVNKKTSLESAVCEMEISYTEKLTAKKRELQLLQKENKEITEKYKKMMEEFDWKEVQKYSKILRPEISRISGRCGTESYVNIGKTLNFSSLIGGGGSDCGGGDEVVMGESEPDKSSSSSSSSDSDSKIEDTVTKTVIKKEAKKGSKSEASYKESSKVMVKETTQTSTIEGSLYVKKGSSQVFDSSRKC